MIINCNYTNLYFGKNALKRELEGVTVEEKVQTHTQKLDAS